MNLFLHTLKPPSALALGGGFSIHLYGLAIAVGILAGLAVVRSLAKRLGVSVRDAFDLAAWLVVVGLVGGRLYHVVNEWWYYADRLSEIPAVWNGGLAIHGAILAGLVTILAWSRKRSLPFFRLSDLFAPALALGQAIGRWGNYFNQELYGKPTGAAWGIPIDVAHRLPGYERFEFFHPLFFYESLLNLGLFVVLFRLGWRSSPAERPGRVTFVYLIGYSAIRFSLDFLRMQQAGFGWLTLAQVTSILLALAGAGMWWQQSRREKTPLSLSADDRDRGAV